MQEVREGYIVEAGGWAETWGAASSPSKLDSSRGHVLQNRVWVNSRLNPFFCGVAMGRGRQVENAVSLSFFLVFI